MADYSSEDMLRMQEEAKIRVKEMQMKSKNIADSFYGIQNKQEPNNQLPDSPKAISMPIEIPERRKSSDRRFTEDKAQKNINSSSVLINSMGNISDEDAEKLFILTLCILLSNEHADKSLLLALMFLIT